MFVIRSKMTCPYCYSRNVSRILYGLHCMDILSKIYRLLHRSVLRGCIICADSSSHHCNRCGEEFGLENAEWRRYDDKEEQERRKAKHLSNALIMEVIALIDDDMWFDLERDLDWEVSDLKDVIIHPDVDVIKSNALLMKIISLSVNNSSDNRHRIYWETSKYGDIISQLNMGVIHINDEDISQNLAEELNRYCKALEQGNEIAQYILGKMYIKDRDVPENTSKGLELLKKSAENGCHAAMVDLAMLYTVGNEVSQDFGKALRLCFEAGLYGNADALYIIGALFQVGGYGVPRDYKKALQFYKEAITLKKREAVINPEYLLNHKVYHKE